MNNIFRILLFSYLVLFNLAYAKLVKTPLPFHNDEHQQIIAAVDHVLDANRNFVKHHKKSYFLPFIKGQTPKVTVLGCADSRVHSHALDPHPDGDLFLVRNIGNQLEPVRGSIEYGVRHLQTPLLLIVGHTMCGAVRTAMKNYSEVSPAIKNELNNLHVPQGDPENVSLVLNTVEHNVNHQVEEALGIFSDELKNNKLMVIGSVYDFRNDYHQGYGRLVIININGDTNAKHIRKAIGFTSKEALRDVFTKR